jgi:hypothetical protein
MPDDFRVALFHPLPNPLNWKRTVAHVEASSDGSTLVYTLVDRQTALSIVPEGVTRIEAFQTVGSNQVNTLGLARFGAAFVEKWLTGPDSRAATERQGIFDLMRSIVPQAQLQITVRVWGHSRIFRSTLQNVAINIIMARLTLVGGAFPRVSATEFDITHDLAGTFVEASCVKKTPFSTAPFIGPGANGAIMAALPDVGQYFPTNNDDTSGFLEYARASVLMQNGLPNRPAIGGTGTRGNFVTRLAAAALLLPNAVPSNPPAIMPAQGSVVDRLPP